MDSTDAIMVISDDEDQDMPPSSECVMSPLGQIDSILQGIKTFTDIDMLEDTQGIPPARQIGMHAEQMPAQQTGIHTQQASMPSQKTGMFIEQIDLGMPAQQLGVSAQKLAMLAQQISIPAQQISIPAQQIGIPAQQIDMQTQKGVSGQTAAAVLPAVCVVCGDKADKLNYGVMR